MADGAPSCAELPVMTRFARFDDAAREYVISRPYSRSRGADQQGDQEHDLNLNGETGTDRLQPGESQTADFGVIDADAQAWCTVPGHKQAGMVLTIAVTAAAAKPPSGPSTTG
jgi:uncharacterized cupredoxin-like copper-binding protein